MSKSAMPVPYRLGFPEWGGILFPRPYVIRQRTNGQTDASGGCISYCCLPAVRPFIPRRNSRPIYNNRSPAILKILINPENPDSDNDHPKDLEYTTSRTLCRFCPSQKIRRPCQALLAHSPIRYTRPSLLVSRHTQATARYMQLQDRLSKMT